MKAEKYGTPSEQRRHECNWRRGDYDARCANCIHVENDFISHRTESWHCARGGFKTQKTAVCDGFTTISLLNKGIQP